jgi:hypothetical protein
VPNTYTPTAVAQTTITEPVDGENRNVASVTAMTRAIANGLAFVSAQTTPLASLATLAAITTPANGLVRSVVGFGWYTFQTSATTGLSPFRVAAADATTGGWVAGAAHETARTARIYLGQVFPGVCTDGASTIAAQPPNFALDFTPAPLANVRVRPFGWMTRSIDTGANNWQFYVPLNAYLVDGATIASATLHFRPANSHAGLPTRQQSICLVRDTYTGSTGASLPNPAKLISTPASGHVALAAASTGALQADQSLVYTSDQNNVVDLSQFSYGAIIADEGGTNAIVGCAFSMLELSLTGIADAGRRN